ncbi:UL16-binding protein 2-like, partial [Ochotona curzoniae]|uniref:UL16-binding protein 2-like n=1 Tax=Ochotona curzoniae TaxID=130825 RepID=UPI001B346B0F
MELTPYLPHLLAVLLLRAVVQSLGADAHSLCHYFTVNTTARPGQPVCDVQGLIDGNIFLTSDCDKTKCIILPGNETHIPDNEEKEMKEIFKDVADTLIQQLSEMNLADYTSRDALSLQARMCCERDATGRKNGSWVFSIGGQKSVLLESHDKEWKK